MTARTRALLLSPFVLMLLFGSTAFAATAPSNEKIVVGQDAPMFTGKTTDDQTISLADLKGKVVLVNFFATW